MVPFARRRKDSSDFRVPCACIVAFVLAFPGLASAGAADPIPAVSKAVLAERPGVSRLQVARDPETGGWWLAPLEFGLVAGRHSGQETALALNHSHEGLFSEPLPGGGAMMNLQGRFLSYSLASRDVAGDVHLGCTDDPLQLLVQLESAPDERDAWGRPLR